MARRTIVSDSLTHRAATTSNHPPNDRYDINTQHAHITGSFSGANYHATQGEEVTVACSATGDPQPQVWWSKVDNRVRYGSDV